MLSNSPDTYFFNEDDRLNIYFLQNIFAFISSLLIFTQSKVLFSTFPFQLHSNHRVKNDLQSAASINVAEISKKSTSLHNSWPNDFRTNFIPCSFANDVAVVKKYSLMFLRFQNKYFSLICFMIAYLVERISSNYCVSYINVFCRHLWTGQHLNMCI